MSRIGQVDRARAIAGWALATTGDAYSVTFPCPVCEEDMTWDALSSVEVAGTDLAHDLPRNGNADAPWTWDACYPACSDCNGDASNVAQPRTDARIIPNPAHRAILASDYRVSTPVAQAVILRNRAVTDGRKARKAAKRNAR